MTGRMRAAGSEPGPPGMGAIGGWRPRAPIATRIARETAQVIRAMAHLIPQAMAPPPEAFFPSHLSVALIDAVFSAGGGDMGWNSAAERYCRHFTIARTRPQRWRLPPINGQETLGDLVSRYESLGVETMAETVFRDSTRFPCTELTRAAYVLGLARALRRMGIDTLQDMGYKRAGALAAAFGVEFDAHVVRMLMSFSGDDDFVWGDDTVRGFVAHAVDRKTVSAARAAFLVRRASYELILSPRHVDYRIWRGGHGIQN